MLDRTDRRILALLSEDARITNKALAEAVDLSPSTCLDRVRRLREAGVLLGAHAEVSAAALGIGIQALIQIRLRRHTRRDVEAFRTHALTLPEVVSIFHVTGASDFVIHVACRDMGHLRDFAMDALTTRREVAHLETGIVYSGTKKPFWPDFLD